MIRYKIECYKIHLKTSSSFKYVCLCSTHATSAQILCLFRTGSYTMMGGRKKNILKKCEEFVISLIKKFDKRVESSSSMMQ